MAGELGVALSTYSLWETGKGEPTGGNLRLVEAFLARHEPRTGERADSAALVTGSQEDPTAWQLWAMDQAELVASGYSTSPAARAEPVTVLWLLDELLSILDRGECRSVEVDPGIQGTVIRLKDNFEKEAARVGMASVFQRAAALTAEFARGCAAPNAYQKVLRQFLDTAYFYGWGEFPPKKPQ